MAVEVLKEKGVPEHRILFLNLIASPSGVAEFAERFPKLRVVTAFIDQGLDDKKYEFRAGSRTSAIADKFAGTLSPGWVILAIAITHCSGSSLSLGFPREEIP